MDSETKKASGMRGGYDVFISSHRADLPPVPIGIKTTVFLTTFDRNRVVFLLDSSAPTMYLRRNIDGVLEAWSAEPGRKPLVLRGARQTGKSSSVRELGRSFDLFLELNLERHEDLALVRACRSAEDLLAALGTRANLERFPERTLLFLDEIQEAAEAVGWLRFLHEDHPGLFVIAAGSLLEVRLEDRGLSFPVGRVTCACTADPSGWSGSRCRWRRGGSTTGCCRYRSTWPRICKRRSARHEVRRRCTTAEVTYRQVVPPCPRPDESPPSRPSPSAPC